MLMIAVIGGTGSYDLSLLENRRERKTETPYGKPSATITTGTVQGIEVAFLSRHGEWHAIAPHAINHKANIFALKELGVERIIATAAVGSLKPAIRMGDVVIPNSFIDFSKEVNTFYDEGRVAHVSLADPFCAELNSQLIGTAKQLKIRVHEKGTYARIAGPQFSTRAASNMYRQFADVIGMTCVPEAVLSREKEMCYSAIASVTDYDVDVVPGHQVSAQSIIDTLKQNAENAKTIIERVLPLAAKERKCDCGKALQGAFV